MLWPEKFKNGVFTLKTHQMFSVHTTPEKFENATITGHFGFLFEENSDGRGNHMMSSFSKSSGFEMFSVHTKNAGVLRFLRIEERFRKALFS